MVQRPAWPGMRRERGTSVVPTKAGIQKRDLVSSLGLDEEVAVSATSQ
jgi:hypothetical protein